MNLPTQNGKWRVAHGKDYFADIVRTRNLDFDQDGIIRLAKKAIALYTSDDNSHLGTIVAIVPDDNSGIYYVITTDRVYTIDGSGSVIEITTSNMPAIGSGSDGVFFNGKLHVSGGTVVKDYASGSWTSHAGISVSASYPIILAVFDSAAALAVGNHNTIQTFDTSYTAGTTLTIQTEYVITSIQNIGANLYIGTRHIYGGPAKLFVWDGNGTSASGYAINASAIFSLCPYESSVAVVASNGQILRFNGGGFDELAHFPVYDTPYPWGPQASIAAASFDVCPNRGTAAIGDRLYLNINGEINVAFPPSSYMHAMPSGLWVYDPDVGLHHRSGHQHNKYHTLTITAVNSSILSVGTHGLATGDPVYAQSVTNITGLTNGQTYYAIVESSTTIGLAISAAAAFAGKSLMLSGTPSGDNIFVDDQSSYGAVADTKAGAICPIGGTMPKSFFTSGLFFGCAPLDDTGSTIKALNGLGLQANRGSFTTSPIPASGVKDAFAKLYAFIEDLFLEADAVVLKYRTRRRLGERTEGRDTTSGMSVWTSTTTFTVDTRHKDVEAVQIGDEVEIISGSGAGYTSKITAIDDSTTTYVFTIADEIPVDADDVSEIVIENWTELGTFTKDSPTVDDDFLEQALGVHGSFIQFKCELRGYQLGVRRLSVVQTIDKPAV